MRPDKDHWFAELALVIAKRSTCARRSVGCLLVNRFGHILSTGYNGVARGQEHCNEQHPCPGVGHASGTGLDLCEAIHAEHNALLQCRDVEEIVACYVTTEPCVTCVKLLLNTSCQRIVALSRYPHGQASRELWERAGRRWEVLS
jgi:dCMP deaminase